MLLTYYYIWNLDESIGVRYVTGDSITFTDESWMADSYVTKEEAQDIIDKFGLKGFEILE